MGHPEENAERLRSVSPLFFADQKSILQLVATGLNDVRFPIDQNDRLVETARANGAEVEYLVFKDEGHGFRKRVNRIIATEAYVYYFK